MSVDQVDSKVAEDRDKIASLEMRIKVLTETVKASENITPELEKIKGATPFIYFSHCTCIFATFKFCSILLFSMLIILKHF